MADIIFVKKKISNSKTNETINENKRKYVSMDKDILLSMDNHISSVYYNKNFTPALGFNQFCTLNVELLKNQIQKMISSDFDSDKIILKIKKTYKNRYFQFIKKLD